LAEAQANYKADITMRGMHKPCHLLLLNTVIITPELHCRSLLSVKIS
jgi:hypothetical protein